MGSIQKIVSTPLRWASKAILNRTLLRFPGGNAHSPIACVYCPEMCRFSCPTAVVSANDAVTPCNKMGLLHKEDRWPGKASGGEALWPVYDCTGCGRCTEYCVYEMPVADQLFEIRAKWKWKPATAAALRLQDSDDPVGDLAEELGDIKTAKRRLKQFTDSQLPPFVDEARALYFLNKNNVKSKLRWESVLCGDLSDASWGRLAGKKWLLHESVWLSRRLARSGAVDQWVGLAAAHGVEVVRPFERGKDCIDCGGEGAYGLLFPTQAQEMAVDVWERDQHRAEGVLCMSERCAKHLRASLGQKITVLALSELQDG